jgi:hypothetical protein
LPANIRTGWKRQSVTNTLAYYVPSCCCVFVAGVVTFLVISTTAAAVVVSTVVYGVPVLTFLIVAVATTVDAVVLAPRHSA